MKASLKRCALVLLLGLPIFEAILQLAVTRPERWEELALTGLFGLVVGGLIWTVLEAFPHQALRAPYRIALFVGYIVLAIFLGNVYSWHIRPNVGLYREPVWVAQHPGFQKELQARIERNRW